MCVFGDLLVLAFFVVPLTILFLGLLSDATKRTTEMKRTGQFPRVDSNYIKYDPDRAEYCIRY